MLLNLIHILSDKKKFIGIFNDRLDYLAAEV